MKPTRPDRGSRAVPRPRTARRTGRRLVALLAMLVVAGVLGACAKPPIRRLPPLLAEPTGQLAPGKFVWIDLVSQDLEASRAFYGALFGWTFEDLGEYVRISNDGQPIAGMVQARNPDHGSEWLGSLSVVDVDDAVAIAIANGAIIERKALDIPERGRMALISDPEAALLLVLRATGGDPLDATPAIGAWFWRELWSQTPTDAQAFYEALVGYVFADAELNDAPYSVFMGEGKPRAGVVQAPPEIRPTWLHYVRVADVDATVGDAERLGARIFAHDGNRAILVDPVGAPFGVQAWEPRDEAEDRGSATDATPGAAEAAR